ncbi:hypothetical protein Lser_V15G30706 [Lactuca serriola]
MGEESVRIKQDTNAKRFLIMNPIRYILREQRILYLVIGIAISVLLFNVDVIPSSPALRVAEQISDSTPIPRRITFEVHAKGSYHVNIGKKSQRVVVTGGAGFVGSHLVDRLMARGDSVIVVDSFFTGRKDNLFHHLKNPRFELIRHDVILPFGLPCFPCSLQIQPLLNKNNDDHKTNVVGTLNMLGLAKRINARFLLTSTSEVYGDPLEHPQVETYWDNVNPIGVRSCYHEGKHVAETLTMDYHRGLNIEDGRVVSNFVAQALRREPMTVYGDGKQTRSFQYVSDLVEGLMRLMEGEDVGPFNLGNPSEFTMLELANAVQVTIDLNAKIEFRPNTEDDPQ